MNEKLQNSVVLVTSSNPDIADFGTGFVIHRDDQAAYVLTCAHNVDVVGGQATVEVSSIQARVVALGSEDGIDLAVLRVTGLDKVPLSLSVAGEKCKSFTTAGFQLYNKKEYLLRPLNGELDKQVLIGVTSAKLIKGWDLKITDGDQLQLGYSGSPVVDGANGTVVGVIRTRQGDGKRGQAISVEALQKIWQEMPPGLLAKQTHTATGENSQEKDSARDELLPIAINVNPSVTVIKPWNIPFSRNEYFTGQRKLIVHLQKVLTNRKAVALTQKAQALCGLGGIGKTQLAVEYAYLHREDYQAVLWVRADSHEALVQSFVELTRILHLSTAKEQDHQVIVKAVKGWLGEHTNWLLIFDNVDDTEVIKDFLPQEGKGHILFTTRSQAISPLADEISMDVMSSEDATLFLLRRIKEVPAKTTSLKTVKPQMRVEAEDLVRELGYLPLAIDQVGAYIHETRCDLATYLKIYQQYRPSLLKRRGLYIDYPNSVATTMSLALEKVKAISVPALKILEGCVFLHPDAIPEEILEALADNMLVFNDATKVLLHYSLIRRSRKRKAVSVHRLVQAVLEDGMEEQQQREWVENLVHVIADAFTSAKVETERLILHARRLADFIKRFSITTEMAARLLSLAGVYLYQQAQYSEALHLLESALSIREQVLGEEHLDVATSLSHLVMLHHDQSHYDEAQRLSERALSIREKVLGPLNSEVASSLDNLGMLYKAVGHYSEALPLFERAHSIREKVLGPLNPEVASSMNNLGMLYKTLGRYKEALLFLERALSIKEEVLDPEDPSLATSMNNLALLYQDLGRYSEALLLFEHAFSLREKILGKKHPDVARSMNNLALLYQDLGRYSEALPLPERALPISRGKDPKHPDVAHSLNSLAILYRALGRYEEALPLSKDALSICEESIRSDHPDVATSMNNLALLYYIQGNYEKALSLSEAALSFKERVLGPWQPHPSVARSQNNLALLYRALGRYEEALSLFKHALSTFRQVLGPVHPHVAYCMNNLALLYYMQGNCGEALPLFEHALVILELVFGAKHPDVATSMNNLAELYRAQGCYGEAFLLFERALIILEQSLGSEHPHTKIVQQNHASLLQDMQ
jgi:tetratricopeptide (TPR) repeat protein